MLKYKAIIFDVDGTITEHVSSWRHIHEKIGIWNDHAFHYQKKFLAGRISYKKFCELDAAHWRGIPETKIKRIFKKSPYAKNATSSIKKLKKIGFKLVAISTGLQYMTERLKKELGFNYILHNRLLTRNGILTGKVKINITHGAKDKALKKILKKIRVMPHEVISVGDSAGDIPMAKLSGFSIGFNSSDKEFSKIVDYNCKTKDFKEVFNKIIEVSR